MGFSIDKQECIKWLHPASHKGAEVGQFLPYISAVLPQINLNSRKYISYTPYLIKQNIISLIFECFGEILTKYWTLINTFPCPRFLECGC